MTDERENTPVDDEKLNDVAGGGCNIFEYLHRPKVQEKIIEGGKALISPAYTVVSKLTQD